MNSTSFNGMIDLIIAACGIYVLYSCSVMKSTGKIQGGMLMPKNVDLNRCKDPAGFIREIVPKLLVLGIMAFLCGAVGLVMDYTGLIPGAVYLVLMIAFLAALVWYTKVSKKIIKKYW